MPDATSKGVLDAMENDEEDMEPTYKYLEDDGIDRDVRPDAIWAWVVIFAFMLISIILIVEGN